MKGARRKGRQESTGSSKPWTKSMMRSETFQAKIDDLSVKCSKCKRRGDIAITKPNGQRICRWCLGGFPLKGTVEKDRAGMAQNRLRRANDSGKYDVEMD